MWIVAPKPVSLGHLIETTINRLRDILTLFSIHLMHEVRSKSAKTGCIHACCPEISFEWGVCYFNRRTMKMLGVVMKCWESALKMSQIYTLFKQTDYYFICCKHRVLQTSNNLWSSKRTGAIILGRHFLYKRSADSWHFRWVALAQPSQLCFLLGG